MLDDIFDDTSSTSFLTTTTAQSDSNDPSHSLDSEYAREWNTHRINAFHSAFDRELPIAISEHAARTLSSALPLARRIGRIRAKLLLLVQSNILAPRQRESALSAIEQLDTLQLSSQQLSSDRQIDASSNSDHTILNQIFHLEETTNVLLSNFLKDN